MEDMSNLIKQFSEMIEKDGIPENLKEIVNNLNIEKNDASPKNDDVSSSPFNMDGLDINTILKISKMMNKMNVKDNPRSNLLLSLKPYLKDSKKSKIEQYVQFLNIANMLDGFKNTGGDN